MVVQLTQEQDDFISRAVECYQSSSDGCDIVACDGCSGAGKSTAVVEICRRVSAMTCQPPLSLYLLSYSNAAAAVLNKKLLGHGLAGRSYRVMTTHKFGYVILRQSLDFPEKWFLNGSQLKRFRSTCTFLNCNYSLNGPSVQPVLANLFDNVRVAGLLFPLQQSEREIPMMMVAKILGKHKMPVSNSLVELCMTNIDSLMMTYIDHISLACTHLSRFPVDYAACLYIPLVVARLSQHANSSIRDNVSPMMFIVIDEAQDLSRCELELFRALAQQRRAYIRLCGSRPQRIFGFRGAVNDYCSQIPDDRIFSLTTSLRSNDVICDTVRERYGGTGHMIYAAPTIPHGDPFSVQQIPVPTTIR